MRCLPGQHSPERNTCLGAVPALARGWAARAGPYGPEERLRAAKAIQCRQKRICLAMTRKD